MSIHVPLKPEAIERLHKQRRNTTISSLVISILAVVLIALILGIFLLPNILKEVPVIVTYAASLEEPKEVERELVEVVWLTPGAALMRSKNVKRRWGAFLTQSLS